jgi:hypothetical protein
LRALIAELRAAGEIVVQSLESETDGAEESDFIFDRAIERRGDTWQVVSRQGN